MVIKNRSCIRKLTLYFIMICLALILPCNPAFTQTQNPPNPPLLKGGEGGVLLEIKERLIRIEEGQKASNQRIDDLDKRLFRLEEGQKALSQRIDELDKRLSSRIDGIEKRMDYLVNLIYVVLAGMFALVGFVLWDRRSALAPAIRRTRDIEEREEKLERAIKEFALKNPEMKEILKSLGLL
jgi:chaperonin cofactor prefoldin